MQMSIYFYKFNETLEQLMYCERRMSWFLLLFDKHFSNYLQIPSKYRIIYKKTDEWYIE